MMAEERVYPSPTLVAGVGRLGLGVLERLGEDWQTLRLCGGGATLGNLRLLHIAPETDDEIPWRAQERATTRLARHVGDSDLPSLAVNLLILRSLGLVRYRDGCYQVALPRDAGVADLVGDSGEVGVGGACRTSSRRGRR